MITKPMLASKSEDPALLQFAKGLLATPKLDGIRCLKVAGKALSRSFKPISNVFIREWIEANVPDGSDGELVVLNVPFSEIAGHIGRRSGTPDFRFCQFDYVKDSPAKPYVERVADLIALPALDRVMKIVPEWVRDQAQLDALEAQYIDAGYEGVMVRTPGSPYKMGRSTEREGYLLKIKRFEDAEAVILDCVEGMSNQNEAEKDAFGRTKRSTAQVGMVGRGTLGAFLVRDVTTGCEFSLSGFTSEKARAIWSQREAAIGRLVTYRHQPSGRKDAPRFPKFKAFREAWDLSA